MSGSPPPTDEDLASLSIPNHIIERQREAVSKLPPVEQARRRERAAQLRQQFKPFAAPVGGGSNANAGYNKLLTSIESRRAREARRTFRLQQAEEERQHRRAVIMAVLGVVLGVGLLVYLNFFNVPSGDSKTNN